MPEFTVVAEASIVTTVNAKSEAGAIKAWREKQRTLAGVRVRGCDLLVEAAKPKIFDDAGGQVQRQNEAARLAAANPAKC